MWIITFISASLSAFPVITMYCYSRNHNCELVLQEITLISEREGQERCQTCIVDLHVGSSSFFFYFSQKTSLHLRRAEYCHNLHQRFFFFKAKAGTVRSSLQNFFHNKQTRKPLLLQYQVSIEINVNSKVQ